MIVGICIFALTVYGTVLTGGTILTRIQIEQNPKLKGPTNEQDELE